MFAIDPRPLDATLGSRYSPRCAHPRIARFAVVTADAATFATGQPPVSNGGKFAMTTADPNRVILTGENPFIRLSAKNGDPLTTNASFWRIILSPAGSGHVLYLKSELTENRWRIYSDNIAMARWLQSTVQGMLNNELEDLSVPVTEAEFSKSGDPHYFWTERAFAPGEDIKLTWYEIGEPLLIHTQPNTGGRRYGVCTLLIPALGTRLSRNGVEAKGKSWPTEREGRPFSTSALAFSESWTDAR
jgi:hypothetical protein